MSTRARTDRWYVVCSFTEPRCVGGETVPWPASTAHAKSVGGLTTACGLNASTWPRLFHVPFPTFHAENCPECLVVVSR